MNLAARAALMTILLFSAVGAVAAGREAVLKQVDLPHSYYWRELYIPQLTTGPSSVTLHARRSRAHLQHGRVVMAAGHRVRRSSRAYAPAFRI